MNQSDPAYRIRVSYIDKSREYYAAQGYERPYRWAAHDDAPFQPLKKPLAESRIGIVTTSNQLGPGESPEDDPDERPPRRTYAQPVEPPPQAMYTRDLSWDKEATHTRDVETFIPIGALRYFVEKSRIGSLSKRFYGVPTDYSQRRTIEFDAPAVLQNCREDDVDVAVLVPL